MFKITSFIALSFLALIKSSFANPACAVCTIAIGASLTLARKLGVQDSIVGLWAGALLAIIGYWTILFCDKKNWNFRGRNPLIMFISIAMIGFIYIKEVVYTPQVILYVIYMDPILFSSLLGAFIFIASQKLYQYMKKKNNGHAHFPFEKVVLPVAFLSILSIYFNYIKF